MKENNDESIADVAVKDQTAERPHITFRSRGSSGIRSYAGYPAEEYLHNLRGSKRADVFDKMRRSDSKIRKVLTAVKGPIQSATWEIQEPKDATTEEKIHAEFVEQVMFEDLGSGSELDPDFDQYKVEALTALDFGFSLFEVIHQVNLNHPKWGNYIGLSRLGWRSPRTIERWNLCSKTERLLSVAQQADGDLQRMANIPAKDLILISLNREGANFEGISALRYCYGAWLRKQTNLKLMAIGLEKYAVPTPIGTVHQMSGPEFEAFIDALEAYTSHEANYLTLPKGWDVTLKENNFDVQKVKAAIDLDNMEIVDSFIANFLELGMSGGGGAYALSNDMSDFFLSSLVFLAEAIAKPLNKKVIPDLVRMKFGPQQRYPKIVATDITDKAGKELAEAIKALVDSKVIKPDDKLEANVRKRFSLPPADPATAREVQPATPFSGGFGLSEESIQLAEKKAKKLISMNSEKLKGAMGAGIKRMGEQLIARLIRESESLKQDQKVVAAKKVDDPSYAQYKKELKLALLEISAEAITEARKEVPKAKNVKFKEGEITDFGWLSSTLQNRIDTQAELLAASQTADLVKAIKFQYMNSAPSTDSVRILEDDLNVAMDNFLQGQSVSVAAANSASQAINVGRWEFFQEPEVSEQIVAFQFVNGDPVSPICQDLAGRIFAKDDPEAERYMPPLHHNCKSYIVPILKGESFRGDIERLRPSRENLEKFITLKEPRAS